MKKTSTTRSVSKNKRAQPITKDMNLREVLEFYPATGEVMMSYGLHCVGCFANSFDTIHDAMRIHGMTEETVNEMVEKMNRVAQKK